MAGHPNGSQKKRFAKDFKTTVQVVAGDAEAVAKIGHKLFTDLSKADRHGTLTVIVEGKKLEKPAPATPDPASMLDD